MTMLESTRTTDGTVPFTPVRRHDLDWLRVIAVLLLFPFHTARVFDIWEPFYVKGGQTSEGLSWAVVAFLDAWHMPLLFVLAGAATWFALGHRTPGAYAGERIKRLLVPFAFGLLVIVPPQAYLARLFRGHDISPGAFLGDYWSVEGDLTGYTGNFTPGHLWFIGFLFVLALVALPLFVRWRRSVRVPWLPIAMPLILLTANELPATEDGPQSPWYALALFAAGFLLVADGRTERFVHRSWRPLLVAAGTTMATVMLVWSSGIGDRWADGSLVDVAFSVLEEANTWIWILALLGIGRAFLSFENRMLRYAGEASYPVYLLHQTVIVAVGFAIVGWDLAVWPAFAAITLISLVITLGVYEVAVRRKGATRFLFGMKPRPAAGPAATRRPEPAFR